MNTKIAVKTPVGMPVWRQPDDSRQRILQQVRKLTQDIHALQTQLYRELAQEDGSRRDKSLLVSSPALDDLMSLKTAADQLRRVVWFHLQAFDNQEDRDIHVEPVDLEETASGRESMKTQQSQPGVLEPGSFFERLNLAVDGCMQQRGITGTGKRTKT